MAHAPHAYLVCHSEERSDVAISLPQKRPMSRRSIAVLIITSNERQAVSNAVAVINDAVNSMAAGETHVLHIHAT